MAIRGQPSNIDYASPTQFQLVINQLPEVEFFITNLTLPGINLGEAVIPTPMKQIPVMGDEITFENLSLQFLVNETFENYMEIHNWLIAIGFPQSHTQFSNWRSTNSVTPEASRGKETDIGETTLRTSAKGMFSDATITLLTNKNNPIAEVKFQDLHPVALTALEFSQEQTSVDYLKATAEFQYKYYTINKFV
tara:strand:+ start:36199 stop:36777 length:579 start_codon:yes stop_codon:yes gene_type:complete